MINTASVLILFEHTSYFKKNDCFISVSSKYSFCLNTFWTHYIWKKINTLFIIYFGFGKYSFSLNTFWTHIFWWKLIFLLLLIPVLVNKASVSTLFECTSYFLKNDCFISVSVNTASVSILFDTLYCFCLNTFWTHIFWRKLIFLLLLIPCFGK